MMTLVELGEMPPKTTIAVVSQGLGTQNDDGIETLLHLP